MVALETPENDPYVRKLRELGKSLAQPRAILLVSAHWYVRGKFVDVSERPETVYDFYGFPDPLYAVKYPCPGYPAAAEALDAIFAPGEWKRVTRGLDHGGWTVLTHLFPKADVPVVSVSLDATESPKGHFEIGRKLAELRSEGFLIVCSGNIVHDLSSVDFSRKPGSEPYPFAKAFDDAFEKAVSERDYETLFEPQKMPGGVRSVPTPEHFLPALVALGAAEDEPVTWLCGDFELGSISRRAFSAGEIEYDPSIP